MKTVLGEKRRRLELGRVFDGGKEGGILEIVGYPDEVAKIYKKPVGPETVTKLRFMIANPPKIKSHRPGRLEIAWPQELLFDPQNPSRCVGFTMQRIRKMKLLFALRQKLTKKTFTDQLMAVQICIGLAILVASVHRAGHVIPDLNERNVLVNWKTGGVALVDCDSFQIKANGTTFLTKIHCPPYLSPELQGKNLGKVPRTKFSDRFALAALIGELLGGGHHPFAAIYTGPGTESPLDERIKDGLWPDRRGGVKDYKRRDTAPAFECLPVPIQELFERCFDDGHRDPKMRPSPSEWATTLKAELSNFNPLTYPPAPYRFSWASILSGLKTFTSARLEQFDRLLRLRLMMRWAITHPVLSIGIMAPIIIAGWVYFYSAAEAIPVRMKTNDFTPSTFIEGEPTPKIWEEISRTTSRTH